jgi:hypothetical protein
LTIKIWYVNFILLPATLIKDCCKKGGKICGI